jgi:hypothetical protein
MNDVVVRELMNGTLFVLDIEMVLTFGIYLVRRVIEDFCAYRAGTSPPMYSATSPAPFGILGWYKRPGSQAAIALTIHLVGAAVRAGWIWWLLHCQNAGTDCAYIQSSSWILVVATLLAMIGGLCCIRVFSPPNWRPWSWIGAGIIALSIPTAIYLG